MNSRQRRKAYRKMPKPGTRVEFYPGRFGTVIGPWHSYHTCRKNRGGSDSVNRVAVRLDDTKVVLPMGFE